MHPTSEKGTLLARAILATLKSSWKTLILSDILFKGVAFVLLTPLVSLLFRGFLWASGRSILADVDIARFALHPIGWLALVVVGGASIAIWALEQATLMAISLAAIVGRTQTVVGSLHFALTKAKGVFQIAARIVARVLVLAAPFLAAGGALYWWLLTDHDINYYLDAKPPRFWWACALIGMILVVLAAIVIRALVNWSIALQLHLFEGLSPRDCLRTSRNRVYGNRLQITKWIIAWLVISLLVSSVGSMLVLAIGRRIVPATVGSLVLFNVTLGLMIVLWGAVSFGGNLMSVITLAILQTHVYVRFGKSPDFVVPGSDAPRNVWSVTLTRRRLFTGLAIAMLAAALVGMTAIHSVRLEDNVEITAHRGASGKAPENTLASVRQAIEDGTDWVEIDVQESKDGVVIVAHDSDLKKISGADVKIWNATAEELRAIDIGSYFGASFKNERVPTLAEVLEACRGRVRLNIELKYYGHTQDLERKVIALVEEYEMADHVVIMSLDARGIKKVKQLRPAWTVGLLAAVSVGDLTRADADFLAVNTKLATRSFVQSAHKKNKRVYVWTANDAVTLSTMISRGCDNVITDHPELARQVLNERAEMSPVERMLVELAFLFGIVPPSSSEP